MRASSLSSMARSCLSWAWVSGGGASVFDGCVVGGDCCCGASASVSGSGSGAAGGASAYGGSSGCPFRRSLLRMTDSYGSIVRAVEVGGGGAGL